ncbi:hypothetical protein A9308_01105 [Moraxella atlantae]|uniref:Branched-chain amino acid aminotransferase/4-amino-4-deoxychorismate lyase n=1 Tax=Faucicola atlantae TaxID=34059 RepID=A0A1B8Q8L4_9GAMM|nr:aminotransferase class IV family protein [Moraxella atlantae]OBX73075.1 hypothetical protein A9308_01105 [Moraxella atlantae]
MTQVNHPRVFDLFETIAIVQGKPQNLAYHQHRYACSLAKFYPNTPYHVFDLADVLQNFLAKNPPTHDLMRCRVDYHASDMAMHLVGYQRRGNLTFQPVICDDIDYTLKFTNRDQLNTLLQQRGACDEVIIIKHGFVTDCTIGNLVLKKNNHWYTPSTPLLNGTQRAKLLAEHRISVCPILLRDLDRYEEIRLINALNPLV